MPVSRIGTRLAPSPKGPYAQGTRANGLIFVSGQLPAGLDGRFDPATSFAAQARQALAAVLEIVAAGSGSPDSLARLTVYLTDLGDRPAFDILAAEVLGASRPAITVVPVAALPHDCRVQIDAIAAAEWR